MASVVASLCELGYPMTEANEAAKRCSSVEACVAWLLENPFEQRAPPSAAAAAAPAAAASSSDTDAYLDDEPSIELARQLAAAELAERELRLSRISFACCIGVCDEPASCPISEAVTLDCDHRCCRGCMTEYLQHKINEDKVDESQLVCPHLGCGAPVSYHVTTALVPSDVIEKLDRFRIRRVEGLTSCPRSCGWAVEVGARIRDVTCAKCQYRWCAKCSNDVHEGSSCEEFRRWKLEQDSAEQKFADLVAEEKLHPCPQCGAVVQRTSGCNVMTCTCKQKFCYLCGSRLDGRAVHFRAGVFGNTCINRP